MKKVVFCLAAACCLGVTSSTPTGFTLTVQEFQRLQRQPADQVLASFIWIAASNYEVYAASIKKDLAQRKKVQRILQKRAEKAKQNREAQAQKIKNKARPTKVPKHKAKNR